MLATADVEPSENSTPAKMEIPRKAGEFEPGKYHDTYRDNLRRLIAAGMDGLGTQGPAQLQLLFDDVYDEDRLEAEIPQHNNQCQADRPGPDNRKN